MVYKIYKIVAECEERFAIIDWPEVTTYDV